MTLAHLQQRLVAALSAQDPIAALAAAREDGTLTSTEREHLAGVDPDGLLLTALLVKKLRFESLLRGDPDLRHRFDRDPDGFASAFEDYVGARPRRAVFPSEEAARFRSFLGDPS